MGDTTASLVVEVSTGAALTNLQMLSKELDKLRLAAQDISKTGILPANILTQQYRTAAAEMQTESSKIVSQAADAGSKSGKAFVASYSVQLKDGTRIALKQTGDDLVNLATNVGKAGADAISVIGQAGIKTREEVTKATQAARELQRIANTEYKQGLSSVIAVQAGITKPTIRGQENLEDINKAYAALERQSLIIKEVEAREVSAQANMAAARLQGIASITAENTELAKQNVLYAAAEKAKYDDALKAHANFINQDAVLNARYASQSIQAQLKVQRQIEEIRRSSADNSIPILRFGSKAATDTRTVEDIENNIAASRSSAYLGTRSSASSTIDAKTVQDVATVAATSNAKILDMNSALNDTKFLARGALTPLNAMWLTWGSMVPLVTGAAISATIKESITAGAGFESLLARIQGASGAAKDQVTALGKSILDSSKTSRFDPTQSADGVLKLVQAGQTLNQAAISLPTVLDLATAGEIDLGKGAEIATAALAAFNLPVTELAGAGSALAKMADASQTNISEMGEALKLASSAAAQFKVPLDVTLASLATFAQVNIRGTSAGTAFKNMLSNVYTPTNVAAKAMAELSEKTGVLVKAFNPDGTPKEFLAFMKELKTAVDKFTPEGKAEALSKIFNERGLKGAQQVLEQIGTGTGLDTYVVQAKEAQQQATYLKDKVEILNQTVQGQAKQAWSAFQVSMVDAFNDSQGPLYNLTVRVKEFAQSADLRVLIQNLVGGFANLSTFLIDNAKYIKLGAEAWVTYKATSITVGLLGTVLSATAAGAETLALSLQKASRSGVFQTLIGEAGQVTNAISGATQSAAYLGTVSASSVANAAEKTSKWSTILGGVKVAGGLLTAFMPYLGLAVTGAALAWDIFGKKANTALDDALAKSKRLTDEVEDFGKRKAVGDTSYGTVTELQSAQKKANEDQQSVVNAQAAVDRIRANTPYTYNRGGKSKVVTAEETEAVKVLNESKQVLAQDKGKINVIQDAIGINNAQAVRDAKKAEDDATNIQDKLKFDTNFGNKNKGVHALEGAEIRGITKKWDDILKAEEDGFKNEKALIEQRVKYGSVTQEAANILLDQKQKAQDADVQKTLESEIAELTNYQATHKSLDNARKEDLKTTKESLQAKLDLIKSNNASAKLLRDQEVAEIEKANNRAVLVDLTAVRQRAEAQQAKSARAFNSRNDVTNPVEAAGNSAYETSITGSATEVDKYAKKLADARQTLNDLESSGLATNDMIDAQVKAVDAATSAYTELAQAQREAAESAKAQAKEQERVRQTWSEGWTAAYSSYVNKAQSSSEQAKSVFNTSVNSMSSELTKFAQTGKLDFSALATSIIADLIRIQVQKEVTGIFDLIGSAISAASGSFSFGGASIGSSAVSAASTPLGASDSFSSAFTQYAAKGHTYNSGVQAFAKGGAFGSGAVLTHPTFFKFATGGSFADGVAGEAGPEAALPLKRLSNGNLGVGFEGSGSQSSGGQPITIIVNVEGGKDAEETGDIISRKVTETMKNIADQRIQNATRLGGILNKAAA